jgi:hypothetical protein
VDTDGKRFVHVIFENILDPLDINVAFQFGHALPGSAAAKIGRQVRVPQGFEVTEIFARF